MKFKRLAYLTFSNNFYFLMYYILYFKLTKLVFSFCIFMWYLSKLVI